MNFLTVIIYGYILVAGILIFLLYRDSKIASTFFGKHKIWAWIKITILGIGILMAIDARFIEPNILTVTTESINFQQIDTPIKIAWVTDIQIGNHKKTEWMKKIVARLETIKPDLILFGGDLIDNEGNAEDESIYLEPLAQLVGRYPMYYIMGNHEYGVGNKTKKNDSWQTGDRSIELADRMEKMGIPLLRNQLVCPQIGNHPPLSEGRDGPARHASQGEAGGVGSFCLFGIDDIWNRTINFSELKNWNQNLPLIFLTHNPDGILSWPQNIKKPDLVLAGHTHGGQIWLPFIGPLGNAGIELGRKYYRGLNYYNNIPIFTSVGAGESGGPVRFGVPPEIVAININ